MARLRKHLEILSKSTSFTLTIRLKATRLLETWKGAIASLTSSNASDSWRFTIGLQMRLDSLNEEEYEEDEFVDIPAITKDPNLYVDGLNIRSPINM
ncbi:hypothetical protein BC938DRAFT_470720 [Jimgerdemannia flammicorona]|uniref:Uncharacterized protein n=1 Tax=Jimgerdemannia flammicorona TaxID=994334 RepID=A0A433QV61_9FUNG|nr:hypothetical protein BC938DRAFT_470720 [Jimgerdemannia flammicorona]